MIKLFNWWSSFDPVPEGVMAHEITDKRLKEKIADSYEQKYRPKQTPYTHPEKYDPFNPPEGWAYDPYYEIWIEI